MVGWKAFWGEKSSTQKLARQLKVVSWNASTEALGFGLNLPSLEQVNVIEFMQLNSKLYGRL